MKKLGIVLGIIAIIALVGGGVWWFSRDTGTSTDSHTHEEGTLPHSHDEETTLIDEGQQAAENSETIIYTNNGFEPRTITVRAGTTITIRNNSSKSLEFSSDPHPVHTDNTELNERTIGPGQTTTITPTAPGTWGYHNHLDDRDAGTIIVE